MLEGLWRLGQAQWLGQSSETYQDADSEAKAKQHGANINAPTKVGGGKKSHGKKADR